jgi:hypothetical protein
MSGPTPGPDQNYPQGGQNYPQGGAPQGQPGWGTPQGPPPGYPQQGQPLQGYGGPAPTYSGAPAGYGGAARPPQVLVAAVLGFVVGFFALIGALGLFALASLFGLFALFGILYLALAALNIWGGVVALQGKGSTILKIAGAATAGLALLGLIVTIVESGFDPWSLIMIAAGVTIVVLLSQPASQQWFASRGTK